MKWMIGTLMAALAVLTAGTAVEAQEQTPENAQKFLAQLGGLGQMLYEDHNGKHIYGQDVYHDESGDEPVDRPYAKPAGPATMFSAPNRCLTRFQASVTTYSWEDGGTVQRQRDESIDWPRVSSVQVYGQQVEVTSMQYPDFVEIAGPRVYQRFTLPNEALAKRVGYAMEFLRLSCDKTEGTGF
jgi:hypothetical protein